MRLTQLWHYKLSNSIEGLAFSENGNLGAALWNNCAYVFGPDGNLLNKICQYGGMSGVSYCCGMFGFIGWDGHAYITDENGNLIAKVFVGDCYDHKITMTEDGFVACRKGCAFFDFDGNKHWDLETGEVYNAPSYYNGYWYVASDSWKRLLISKYGKVINEISYGSSAYDTAVCGKYLAVTTNFYLHLYDLSDPANPRKLWRVGELDWVRQVAFSPDCKYIVVADSNKWKLEIFDIEGNLILDKSFGDYVWSVTWRADRIAVGLRKGDIYVYKVEGYEPTTFSASTKGASPLANVFASYLKLKAIYQQVSNSNDYKALLLKSPFQRNVFYFAHVSSFIKTLNQLKQFYLDLDTTIQLTEKMLEEESINNAFKILDLIHDAKIDISLIKTILNRADELIENMDKNRPSINCPEDPLKVIEDIVKTNDIRKILSYWSTENSGLDDVIKCLISQIIDEMSKNYKDFKTELLNDLAQKEEKLEELEKY